MLTNNAKPAKPRGMAVAKHKAKEILTHGGSVKNCPYKSQSWRSCFCREMERLQQVDLI